MAAKEKLNIPNKTINSNWQDDIDVDYATYGGNDKAEREYISPDKVSKESIKRIKERKIGRSALAIFKSREKLLA